MPFAEAVMSTAVVPKAFAPVVNSGTTVGAILLGRGSA